MEKPITNYSDIKKQLEPAFPNAEKVDLASVLNRQIVILDFKAFPSSIAAGKEFVVILAELNGKKVSFSCGEVVLKQLNDIKTYLPVKAEITKEKGKRYYTLK